MRYGKTVNDAFHEACCCLVNVVALPKAAAAALACNQSHVSKNYFRISFFYQIYGNSIITYIEMKLLSIEIVYVGCNIGLLMLCRYGRL